MMKWEVSERPGAAFAVVNDIGSVYNFYTERVAAEMMAGRLNQKELIKERLDVQISGVIHAVVEAHKDVFGIGELYEIAIGVMHRMVREAKVGEK